MKRAVVLLLLLFIANPSLGWNPTGHKAISLIAYGQLLPVTRAKVDQLLAQHPDYSKWIAGVPAADRGRVAFLEASTWPDDIRTDSRFHPENSWVTQDIPGLPPGSQARHYNWHFMNMPFSTDGTRTRPSEEPNILTKLRDFEALASMPDQAKTYALPWILHLIGDIHQPLHTMSRFDRIRPDGDQGGNGVLLRSGNLHSYWDSRVGSGDTDRFLNQLTATIQSRHPKPATLEMNVEKWALEGFDLRTQVYKFSGDGTKASPGIYSDAYAVVVRETAYARVTLGG